MTSLYDLLGVLLTSFGLNLIPFAGPSNLLIATNVALITEADPWTLGFLIAVGAASAKQTHYILTFFAGKFVGEKRRKILDAKAQKIRPWAFLALLLASATPVPDDPIIIPLGLLKYNPAKFYLAVFLGKLSITVFGAYLGKTGENLFSPLINQPTIIAISILLTIAVTILLLKVDVIKVLQDIKNRIRGPGETHEQ